MNIRIIFEAEEAKTIWQQISVDAIVGIIGTLLGTIIGWFLNELSNKGKITIYTQSWSEEFFAYTNSALGTVKIKNKPENYEYNMTIEIHNSSNIPKIIRDVKVGFIKKKRILKLDTPKDNATYHSTGPIKYYDDSGAYNIPAHEIVTISLRRYYSSKSTDFSFLKEGDSVWLYFKDEKNKTQKRLIKNINYESIFSGNMEDTQNG